MSRLLFVAFESSENCMGSGIADALGIPFDVICLASACSGECGAEKVMTPGWSEIPPADALATDLGQIASGYSHIAAVASMASKDAMARLAGLLDAAMITDVIEIQSETVFKRPIVAGSLIETVEALASPVVFTFRPAGFAKAPGAMGSAAVEKVTMNSSSNVLRSGKTSRGGSRPDLAQAKVVVSGGRPLRDKETFERVIGGFADRLGAAVGATRAAVDSGIAPNELQVGQTGKIVAPDLYIAAGISGSTQHMAGIKDSKVIVAINKDPDAPIFDAADYGLVADLFEAIPEFESKL
jgi:electron transfer flavoprotein alpha subunit